MTNNQATNSIIASAPGKLMLFGEHAVVYDRPCIVTAVSSRIKVTIGYTGERFTIDAPHCQDVRFVQEAVHIFQQKFKVGNGLQIKTESEFSCQYGFGSSSAVTVATLFALSKIFNINLTKRDIFDLGYKTSFNIQGVGSGFDIGAAVYGGTIYFVTGGKIIEPLKIGELPLVVGYSGLKADTPTLVKNIKYQISNVKSKSKILKLFEEIEIIVNQAKTYLIEGNWQEVGKLMSKNHALLQKLGVSTEKLDKMCNAALDAGGYGAKLSGAGGGDCMIAIIPEEKREKIEQAIKNAGGAVIKVNPNAEGVRVEA